jgi:formylglycine-generating enzyme required for sulfatase activity
MSCLADLPELVGFFSYSREDDQDSHGALSALRSSIQGELRGQLGRTAKTFRLWQDKEAIPSGTLWETEIKNAVGQAVFFIPIITPTVVASPYCRFELESFLAREVELGRDDLVFPILYVDVPELEDAAQRLKDPVLSLIAKRQYRDWREFRYLEVSAPEVRREVARFCTDIRNALRRSWVSPEERKQQEEAAALRRAESERSREVAEAKRRGEEELQQRTAELERQKREAEAERNRIAALEAKAREDEVRRQRQAEVEQQRAEAERRWADERRQREEAQARHQAEAEEGRRFRQLQPRPAWLLPTLIVGSLAIAAVIGAITFSQYRPQPQVIASPPAVLGYTPAPSGHDVLSAAQEQALKPNDTFKECFNCPQMLVVRAGSFTMGSPASEPGRTPDEGPQHTVTIPGQFAVAQYEATFDRWDDCVSDGGCNGYKPSDEGWGRGTRPVINVSRDDVTTYVAWLAKKTGKPYRLLSESEYEYATRAGTQTAYPWGGAIGKNYANCYGCGSDWDNKETAPVGSFAANGFGLFDMVGNVWEWTEDCWHEDYIGAPMDGSAWKSSSCGLGVARGGSWSDIAVILRSAGRRGRSDHAKRADFLGFRVARTLGTH